MPADSHSRNMTYALADCNNFYCSCERVFHPELLQKPVVVLSNNDGCIIARSEESKRLGLKMGTPLYQVRQLLEDNGVAVFSSNYTLYGSLSARVMSLLSRYTPQLDPYSIDEAFLDFTGLGDAAFLKAYGEKMAADVRRSTGIPISVGIAPTKTLAKMASKYAKHYPGYKGCCQIATDEQRRKALAGFDIGDVWGIGRKLSQSLAYYGIQTAADLAAKSESWVKSHFNICVLHTWKELNGCSCIDISELPERQSLCTSRSFSGQGVTDHNILEEAVANFAARCSERLRQQHTCCQGVTVFAYTSRFRTDQPGHVIHQSVRLPVGIQASVEIIGHALALLRSQYRPEPYAYKKAGVILWDIRPQYPQQQHLFDPVDRARLAALSHAIDAINRKNGHDKVRVAIQGTDVRFGLKCEYLSRHYTTDIKDVLVAKADETPCTTPERRQC